jgi:large subunit ribosomal protein L18
MRDRRILRTRRKAHVRKFISGSAHKPRLVVFRSSKHIYAQLVDDQGGQTLAAASDLKLTGSSMEKAKQVGEMLAQIALKKKLPVVVFDRGGYKYHGRVKALADGAREGGLKF